MHREQRKMILFSFFSADSFLYVGRSTDISATDESWTEEVGEREKIKPAIYFVGVEIDEGHKINRIAGATRIVPKQAQ